MTKKQPITSTADMLGRFGAGERDFQGANVKGAKLARADLGFARLQGANLEDADLGRAFLEYSHLEGAKLAHADLGFARLQGANLEDADLGGAKLGGAKLGGANLEGANLEGANLEGANLEGANLERANLDRASLTDARLGGARVGLTGFADLDLTSCCKGDLVHIAPSNVGYRSIVRSIREPKLKEFLRATGMPDVFVEYMVDCARSLDPEQVFSLLQSTFIGYGGPDELFARKLNEALETAGVTTFFFKDDAPPGERLDRVMRRGVNEHDRVILVCSRASLDRPGLLNELVETLSREARDGGNEYLIPVRLDDYVLHEWLPKRADLAQAVRDRVIADFTHHDDQAFLRSELAKLIAALKKRPANPIVHT